MRAKMVAGNWKMNGTLSQVIQLAEDLKKLGLEMKCQQNLSKDTLPCKIVVMPPAIYIPQVAEILKGSSIEIGCQNVSSEDFGAYTGELSVPMFSEFGCRYFLVGHSERRHYFHEDDKFVAQKFHQVKEHGMIPVLCVGETLTERKSGQTEQVIARQLQAIVEINAQWFENCIVAYEPVWAIGTGKTATPEQAQDVHQFIRSWIAAVSPGDSEKVSLLYGGSVNETNAQALFAMPDIDGGLVGGASLNAKQFVDIVTCIN